MGISRQYTTKLTNQNYFSDASDNGYLPVWGRLPGFMWLSNLNFGNLFEIDVATQEAEIRIFGHDNRYGDPLQQIDHMNSDRLLAITWSICFPFLGDVGQNVSGP